MPFNYDYSEPLNISGKFKVGDRVLAFSSFTDETNPNIDWIPELEKYVGSKGVILEKSSKVEGGIIVKFDLDNDSWFWPEECLELVEEEKNQEQNTDLAQRFNSGKTEWSLVDFASLEPMVKVLEYGAKKYAPNNWKKGMPYTKMIESMLRHTFSLLQGEDKDPESGIENIGHILCNAMFISWMMKNRPDLDDRYKEENI